MIEWSFARTYFKCNLIVVYKLTDDSACRVVILSKATIIQSLSSGKILGIGSTMIGLYVLKN